MAQYYWNSQINPALVSNGLSSKRILGVLRNLAPSSNGIYTWDELNTALTASNIPARSIAKILFTLSK